MSLLIFALFTALSVQSIIAIHPIFDPFGDLLQGNILNSTHSNANQIFDASKLNQQFQDFIVDENNFNEIVTSFESKFGKQYSSPVEATLRKATLKRNVMRVMRHNLDAANGKVSYTQAINQFSDLTADEIINTFTGYWPSDGLKSDDVSNVSSIPRTYYASSSVVDPYRAQYVTGIQNQGSCGACVYFAAAAVVECVWAIKGNKLTVLSPQQLNDCARDEPHGNHGCEHGGGTFVPTFDYIKAHGLTSMSNYPYIAKDANCDKTKESQVVAKISNWGHVTPAGKEDALLSAFTSRGPIAVAIHVNDNWAHYKSGIYDDDCPGGRNHAVIVVGYGYDETSNKDYWIVKNQWGDGFGEKGYIRMRRNKNNMCDIAGDAVWVQV